MRVSVVMTVFNAEAYVAEAVESVLGQSRPPDEFIVVDDGSTDGTRAVLDRYPGEIICLSQSNCGQTMALNRAIATASGETLAFQDADDIWCEKKLEHQVAALEANMQIDAIFGLVRQFVSPDVPDHRRIALAPKNEIIKGESRIAMLVRRGAYDKVGGFDETFRATSIIEWLGRAKMCGLRSIVLDEIVALRRLHLTNGGRINAKAQDDETLAALKRVIEARRSLR
jgi:glycosyltransferase involved in cell wall biosynthesis